MPERRLKDSKPGYFHFKEVTRVCILQLISLSQTADRLLDSTAGRTAKPLTSRKSILDLLNAKDKHERRPQGLRCLLYGKVGSPVKPTL